ncbi:uncharacterized protein C16orf46 homolog isoform X2 [Prionailurus viverrinus]|uniref:uncharacterized protein C16orf46 homolog isoform X2 n=1 Tax=Prionailurus viverrinus TaxID=61388 RepID=UPI001FF6052C|nr:uncharacterized protein C16orf46 homolog isoform X2 [Prionailurus viverrinus]
MDLCQENAAELENGENDETQSPEKTELTYTCSDERSEKNHVCCLLHISDITLEQDEKARDFVIGTGWEEAVQGWGRTSPTACIWSRKKLKKARPEEKVLSVEKDECVACACGLKRVDGKGEKRPVELAKHPKVTDTSPFPPRAAPAPLLADHERGCLHWSFLPEKHLVCPPNPGNVRCLATVRLLQQQGAQNYKAKFKAREPRPAVNTQKLVLTEAKQENRPKTLETKVFPKTLLPSLTVSRVVIPASTHRLL